MKIYKMMEKVFFEGGLAPEEFRTSEVLVLEGEGWAFSFLPAGHGGKDYPRTTWGCRGGILGKSANDVALRHQMAAWMERPHLLGAQLSAEEAADALGGYTPYYCVSGQPLTQGVANKLCEDKGGLRTAAAMAAVIGPDWGFLSPSGKRAYV